jgi:hypothetical protein
MPTYMIPVAAWTAGAILALCGTAQAQQAPAGQSGHNSGSSGHHNTNSHGTGKSHTDGKSKSHAHSQSQDKGHHDSKMGKTQSSGRGRTQKTAHNNKGRHDSKKGKDGSSRRGTHNDKGRRDSKMGKGGSSGRDRSHDGTHDNKGRHDSRTDKGRHSEHGHSEHGHSEHAGYPRLQGIGGRNGKYFESNRISRYNGERHYHEDRVVDKHYHEKYGNQFRYYCGGQLCHGWWYSGRYHYHWDHYCWNSHYKHWFCYDSCTNGYYYYCRSHDCYFPVDCGCSTCLASQDDEFVLPCDEVVEDDCGCDDCCNSGCDDCCDECACCSEDEEGRACGECSRHKRVIVEIDEDE